MKFTINEKLTKKLKGLETIGVEVEQGLIVGIKENDEIVPISQEIMELVCLSLMGKKKVLVECFDEKFKITLEQVL